MKLPMETMILIIGFLHIRGKKSVLPFLPTENLILVFLDHVTVHNVSGIKFTVRQTNVLGFKIFALRTGGNLQGPYLERLQLGQEKNSTPLLE